MRVETNNPAYPSHHLEGQKNESQDACPRAVAKAEKKEAKKRAKAEKKALKNKKS